MMFAVRTKTTAKPKNVLRVEWVVFIAVNDAEDKGLRHGGLDDVGNLYEKLTIVKRSEHRRLLFANRPTTEVPPLRGS